MPTYIEVEETPRAHCKNAGYCHRDENPSHFVSVKIGPAVLDPFYKLMQNLAEIHDENMEREGGMTQHRREEPKCEYCATIKAAQKTWRAINGRSL